MIARLKGVIEALAEGTAIVDVGGVGYLVACSGRTLARLAAGERVTLWIETQVREDGIFLFGFLEAAEQYWFKVLTTVQGVGGKAALAILSTLAPDDLVATIAAGDRVPLTRASGIGPKLASRIVSELKDKVVAVALQAGGGPGRRAGAAAGSAAADAVSALVNLGFKPAEAFAAVSTVSTRLGDGADLDALIRRALNELSRAELSQGELSQGEAG